MSRETKHATAAGTLRYSRRFGHLAPDHFRQRYGLWLSSVGIGTYLGDTDPATSRGYVKSIQVAVQNGCNLIDTAVNYRHMQSERDVAQALQALCTAGNARRDELVICTKGGFIPYDGEPPADRLQDLQSRFFEPGLARPEEIAGGVHCMAPAYLASQIRLSLENLGLESIDVYYLHNPEYQLAYVTPDEFRRRLRAAFVHLEEEVAAGRVRFYGIATWEGLRTDPDQRNYLPLYQMVNLAREIGGERHHFRFLQFPYNLAMLEAVTEHNQFYEKEQEGKQERIALPLLAAARQYSMVCVSSASLHQAQLLGRIPAAVTDVLGDFQTDAQYALQFNRSTPGLTTALVGMCNPKHVEENLVTARVPALAAEEFFALFGAGANAS